MYNDNEIEVSLLKYRCIKKRFIRTVGLIECLKFLSTNKDQEPSLVKKYHSINCLNSKLRNLFNFEANSDAGKMTKNGVMLLSW